MKFTWIKCGSHDCICDSHGRITAYIVIGLPTTPVGPIPAFVDAKNIGLFINPEAARLAVEEFLVVKNDRYDP